MKVEVTLDSIEFNHDKSSARNSALNIRRNHRYEVLLPEWKSSRSRKPADSPAAYALAETRGQTVTVRATLHNGGAEAAELEVVADGGGPLGAVRARRVEVGPGASVTVQLPLSERRFHAVGVHDVAWHWRARPADRSGGWVSLGTTRHRIYLLLGVPMSPWSPSSGSQDNPWADLLDFSCAMAAGELDGRGAAVAIVKSIYADERLKYDIERGASRYFSTPQFLLSWWIERVLQGHRTDAPYAPGCPDERYWRDWTVACMDCAGGVTLMSTVLGVDAECLWQTPFGYIPVLEPIGRGPCNNPFYDCSEPPIVGPGLPRSSFAYHAYAAIDERRYDACLGVPVPLLAKLFLWAVWVVITALTLGRVRPRWIQDRAGGWLVGLPRTEYEELVITSSPSGITQFPGKPVRLRVPFL